MLTYRDRWSSRLVFVVWKVTENINGFFRFFWRVIGSCFITQNFSLYTVLPSTGGVIQSLPPYNQNQNNSYENRRKTPCLEFFSLPSSAQNQAICAAPDLPPGIIVPRHHRLCRRVHPWGPKSEMSIFFKGIILGVSPRPITFQKI